MFSSERAAQKAQAPELGKALLPRAATSQRPHRALLRVNVRARGHALHAVSASRDMCYKISNVAGADICPQDTASARDGARQTLPSLRRWGTPLAHLELAPALSRKRTPRARRRWSRRSPATLAVPGAALLPRGCALPGPGCARGLGGPLLTSATADPSGRSEGSTPMGGADGPVRTEIPEMEGEGGRGGERLGVGVRQQI